jgi:hypothetical protein
MSEVQGIPDAQDISYTRSADYKEVFVNLFKGRIGNGEAAILFSKITHTPSLAATPNVVEEQVEITMTWVQLKILSIYIGDIVQGIEDELGVIPIPATFQQGIRANPQAQRAVVKSLGLTASPTGDI